MMRLNHDCIRDILLYIEDNSTDQYPYVDGDELISSLASKYDADTINYHVRQIDKANLVDKVMYAENVPHLICDLSWEGRHFLDNIRDIRVWNKLKAVSKGLVSVSLPILIEKAPDIVKSFM